MFGGNPQTVPSGYAHQASNFIFREDQNRPRPLIQNIELYFESEAQRIWFQAANGQGATFYNPVPSFLSPKLIASLGGRIFTIEIQGNAGIVRQLFDGNSRQFMHAWFAQGFQYLLVQDGINPPMIWDGTNPARRSDIVQNEVPIGSVMAFIHGRFVVASADGRNSIYVGDIAYGDNATVPEDILSFTEDDYWAEGNSFDTPINVGNIMGLYPMPFLDTGTGQNELVVGCVGGFTSLDLSKPREQWITSQVQRVALVGDGLVSSHGFAGLNGDMFFRSQSGINTYRNARIEYSQRWNNTPISREVNYWIKPDRRDLWEFIPMVSWQNMVLTGCSPFVSAPNNPGFGYHRYCRGMVVFDADNMSNASREGTPVWHGQWTGIRPWAFAQGTIQSTNRCFAFSYDRDGKNRLYEFTLATGDDVFETQPRKIQAYYTTAMLGQVEARTSAFAPKRLNGGAIEFSGVLNQAEFSVLYRPDGSPCWIELDEGNPGCECPPIAQASCSIVSAPWWGRKYFEQIKPNVCVPGSVNQAWLFHHCQLKVETTGTLVIDRLNIRMDLQPDGQVAKCLPPNSGEACERITCCPSENDYTYHIAPAGTNAEVPVIPGQEQVTYISTRSTRLCCPGFPTLCTVGIGQATSTVSQQAADLAAQAAANSTAATQLQGLGCPTCGTAILDDFFIDGGNQDLSGFFVSGEYEQNTNQPWRLQDVLVEETIASGIVNASGTLQTYATFPQYTHGTFDPNTNVYTDAGGGSTRINLQLGCNIGGADTWPTPGEYLDT